MIEAVDIKNFRCFESLRLRKCAAFNVAVGVNASGKTALLEALFLALGPSPEIATRYRIWRGFDANIQGTLRQVDEAMWGDLFYGTDTDRKVVVKLVGSGPHQRTLTISFGGGSPITSIAANQGRVGIVGESAARFEWKRGQRRAISVRPTLTTNGYAYPGIETPAVHASFAPSTRTIANSEVIAGYSDLRKEGNERFVVDALVNEFPFIRDIDILSHGGVPMLHAGIRGLRTRMPLASISSGVNKLASYLTLIAASANSVAVLDEIENGFHHERYGSICRTLRAVAAKRKVQLFASTHSGEFLHALAQAFEEKPKDLTLLQMVRQEEGGVTVNEYNGPDLPEMIQRVETR